MDFDKLNSLTKYPSIPTYHALGKKGGIAADADPQVTFRDEDLIITEKLDGASSRIILVPAGDWLIGSREELLTARGDRIPNSTLRIVEALRPIAERTMDVWRGSKWASIQAYVTVIFAEIYGVKGAGNPKRYTRRMDQVGARVFDIAIAPLNVLNRDRADIASWRDHSGQQFVAEFDLFSFAKALDFELTPRLVSATSLPSKPAAVLSWLKQFSMSQCVLDADLEGMAEGVVVRTKDRSKIAKIRFDDYRKIHAS